jgi:hypothetical protein
MRRGEGGEGIEGGRVERSMEARRKQRETTRA